MEAAKLNTYIVATPEPHIGGMYWIFLSIETKCGILGIGEVYEVIQESTHPKFDIMYLPNLDWFFHYFHRCCRLLLVAHFLEFAPEQYSDHQHRANLEYEVHLHKQGVVLHQ